MRKKLAICLTFLLSLSLVYDKDTFAMSSRPTRPVSYPVRVAVVIDAPEINLKIKGDYGICALPLLEPIKEGNNLRDVTVKPTHSGILIGGEQFKIYGIKIKTDSVADIYINGRRFRGEMDIIRTEDLKLMVINRLDIEDYISGVLYHEVSHWWPMEALKAQAIASRTFAIYKTIESEDKDYDVRSDIYSQVYGGKTSEKFRTNRAVQQTAGNVLIYGQEILPAYFHATCGGYTEDASLLWNTNIRPLKGRRCGYCKGSPHFNWVKKVALEFIEERLKENGYKIRNIRGIKTSSRDASGRVKVVSIADSLGAEKMPANKFRLAVGPNVIRSTDFTVKIEGTAAIFDGRGWGHGVGMCQWGAYYMARQRFKAEDILKFYYPGARITDLKELIKNN